MLAHWMHLKHEWRDNLAPSVRGLARFFSFFPSTTTHLCIGPRHLHSNIQQVDSCRYLLSLPGRCRPKMDEDRLILGDCRLPLICPLSVKHFHMKPRSVQVWKSKECLVLIIAPKINYNKKVETYVGFTTLSIKFPPRAFDHP